MDLPPCRLLMRGPLVEMSRLSGNGTCTSPQLPLSHGCANRLEPERHTPGKEVLPLFV